MPTTAHGAPYPSTLDAPDGAAQVMALATWADQHGIYYAASSADRDAQYGDLPAGAIVSSGPAGQVWQKTGADATWRTLYSETGWLVDRFTPADPWSVSAQNLQARQGMVDFQLKITYQGPGLAASADIVNIPMGALDVTYAPKSFASLSTATYGLITAVGVTSGGNVDLNGYVSNIVTGYGFWLQGSWSMK